MAGNSAIRGSRVGAGPTGDTERGELVARLANSYWCANQHETIVRFALDAEIPEIWECQYCGLPSGLNKNDPPRPNRIEPYKTHLTYVKERRSAKESKNILTDAMKESRSMRKWR